MQPQVISFHCTMKNRLGHVLSTSFSRDVINQAASGTDSLLGLVEGLQSVRAGEKRRIAVPAGRAYGNYDLGLVLEIPRSDPEYAEPLNLGSQILRYHRPLHKRLTFRVIRIDHELAVLDGNHPLAGQDLIFEVEIVSARDALASEVLDSDPPRPGQLKH